MPNSNASESDQARNTEHRHAFVRRWAEFVRTHDDTEWSRQQNTLIDAQVQSANELAAAGDTDPIEFYKRRDRLRTDRR